MTGWGRELRAGWSTTARRVYLSMWLLGIVVGPWSPEFAGEGSPLGGVGTGGTPRAAAISSARGSSESLQEIRELVAAGGYRQAVALARERIASYEARGQGDSLDALRFQDLLVEALWRGTDLMNPESLRLAEETLLAKERICKPDDPEIAPSLDNLAAILRLRGQESRACGLYERSLALREAAWGLTDLRLVPSLVALSDVVNERGEISRSLALAQRAYQIASMQETAPEPELRRSLASLGSALMFAGQYEESRDRLQDVVRRIEQTYGPEHPELGGALSKLGAALAFLGAFGESRSAYERAVVLTESTCGPADVRLSRILGNFGTTCWRAGDYAEAKDLIERALRILDVIGEGRTQVRASHLVNLAMVFRAMGDWPNAARNYEAGLGIVEQVLSPQHPTVGAILHNLGNLYSDMGDFEKSRDYFERALSIWEKAYPPEHPLLFQAQSNLARQLQSLKEYDRARMLHLCALAAQQKVLGPDHPDVSETLENLGELYEARADITNARDNYQQALRVREKAYGPRHRKVAKSLNNLARTEIAAGNSQLALDLALRAEAIARDEFEATSKVLSESEALLYEQIRISGLDVAFSVLASPDSGSSRGAEVEQVWEDLIRSRAKVLDEMAVRHRTVVSDESPAIRSLVDSLTTARSGLSHLLASGPDPKNLAGYPAALAAAEKDLQKAEKDLAAKSASFREEISQPTSWLQALRAALPPDGALLAYVSFSFRRPLATGDGAANAPASSHYGILLLAPGEPGARFLRLGLVDEIDRRALAWRSAIDGFRNRNPLARSSSESLSLRDGRELRRAIWDPVAPLLHGVRQLFIVPEGTLNLVSFASLPGDGPKYLIETAPLIHYLSAERDAVLSPKPPTDGRQLLAFGGPDFDLAPGSRSAVGSSDSSAAAESTSSTPRFRGSPPTCADFLKLKFDPLPETVAEVSEIGALFGSSRKTGGKSPASLILTGPDASERSFKGLSPSRSILHLATHGFFLGDCDADPSAAPAGDKGGDSRIPGARPLMLSGLVLAGANRRAEAGPGNEDGVVTAEEIASLDLSRVEWAVLSACETGVGRLQAGEGVLGLRRAFQVAGARTLIMSLWKVEDESTRTWMRQLYRARKAGFSTAEAVRSASLSILRGRRAKGRSTHPFYWGAFVAAGDWR